MADKSRSMQEQERFVNLGRFRGKSGEGTNMHYFYFSGRRVGEKMYEIFERSNDFIRLNEYPGTSDETSNDRQYVYLYNYPDSGSTNDVAVRLTLVGNETKLSVINKYHFTRFKAAESLDEVLR